MTTTNAHETHSRPPANITRKRLFAFLASAGTTFRQIAERCDATPSEIAAWMTGNTPASQHNMRLLHFIHDEVMEALAKVKVDTEPPFHAMVRDRLLHLVKYNPITLTDVACLTPYTPAALDAWLENPGADGAEIPSCVNSAIDRILNCGPAGVDLHRAEIAAAREDANAAHEHAKGRLIFRHFTRDNRIDASHAIIAGDAQ